MGVDICGYAHRKDASEIFDNDRVEYIRDVRNEIFGLEMTPNIFSSAETYE